MKEHLNPEVICHDELEREGDIRKFGRFIKDIPFLELGYTETFKITENPEEQESLFRFLDKNDSLVMLNEHKYLIESSAQNEDEAVQFDRISARSGQNSRHGVFFGTLYSNKYVQDIAIKVFDDNQGGAHSLIDEVVKTSFIKESGLKTFSSVALGAYSGSYYSLWKLERQVSTLDSIDWSYFIDDIDGNQGMVSIFRKVAETAAILHSNGWAHADFHPRNLAVDVTGSVFAIDWETANLSVVDKDDYESRYQKSYLDLSSFMTGCFYPPEHFNSGIGIFKDVPNKESLELFKKLFLDHYVTYRVQFSQDPKDLEDMKQLLKDIDELPDMIR